MKKYLNRILTLAVVALGLTACNKDEIASDEPGGDFSIEQRYLNNSIGKKATVIEIPVKTTLASGQWYIDTDVTWILTGKKSPSNGVGTLSLTVEANNTGETRTGTVKVSTTTVDYKIIVKQYADDDLRVEEDIPITPISAKATNFHEGEEIEKSFDGNTGTMFHSHYTSKPFPFELLYRFEGQEQIDYIEYVPRTDGGANGNIQELEIYYAEDAARTDFQKVGDYNFNGSSAPSRVSLPAGKKPTAIKFVVKSGINNNVSCAEMRFMRRNTDTTLNRTLLEVFTDLTCSELNPGVTADDLTKLDPAFQRIGEVLLNGTYDPLEKSFRVHEYKAYSDPVEWSVKLMTKKYSTWDNPMGIAVKKGEPVMILVGETWGNEVQLQILGENQGVNSSTGASYLTIQRQGHFVSLNPGVNMITPDQDGQLFFMYTAVPSAPTSKPIKVHVPVGYGEFAGYFDLEEHQTDEKFSEIRSRSSHKYMCIKGKRMLLYFNRSTLPRKIVDPINQWDNIITWQQDFMGIDDVRPDLWNNHLAGITLPAAEGGYMWASDWTMGFAESAVSKIMGLEQFNAHADNAWGPAHEMGHVNQTAINWASTTESSNNLFSNYVLYRFNRYSSRGQGLYYRFGAVYEKDHSWASMHYAGEHTGPEVPLSIDGDGTHMGEDTEIHMRLNWQLWNYYHRVKGDEKFFARVFKKMREVGLNETEDPGRKQLEFAVACSEAAGEDLTDFFEAWGFFKPHNSTISQYGDYKYRVTPDMISDAKARMAKCGPKAGAVEYIEDRDSKTGPKNGDFEWDEIGDLGYYTTYANKLTVAASASASVSGRTVTLKNCDNAVAAEIRLINGDGYGEVRYASNKLTFSVPANITVGGCGVYAVQYDGKRILLCNM
ncbi:MAG: M60 family metallopeptidase [Bacteroides sp.]|nr:M60 family metallopeptidase [Bacteroides sp.]MCM1379370.1 M60 family metallopeptidase [Bacteroides sp.]MCM1445230.1 M60 family metallopeptidase [Prevotella sp.]